MIVAILRREAARARTRQRTNTTQPTVRLLLQDIAEGIRVLQTRDGVEVSEELIQERARNIVTGLLGQLQDPRARRQRAARRRSRRCCRWICSISSRSGPKRATTGAPAAPSRLRGRRACSRAARSRGFRRAAAATRERKRGQPVMASQGAGSVRGATVQPPAWSSASSFGDWDGGLGVGVGTTWWGSEVGAAPGEEEEPDAGGGGGELCVGGAAEGAEVDAAAVGGGLVADVVGGVALVGRALGAGEAEVAGGEVGEADGGREVTGAGGGAGVVLLVGEEVVVACWSSAAGASPAAATPLSVSRLFLTRAVPTARTAVPLPASVALTTSASPPARTATPSTRQSRTMRWVEADAGRAVGDLDAGVGAGDGDAVEAGALARVVAAVEADADAEPVRVQRGPPRARAADRHARRRRAGSR